MNNNRELVLEAENVIKQLAAEVQTIASATAAEQRAATAYERGVELVAAATNQIEAMEQRAATASLNSVKLVAEASEHFRATADSVDEKLREMLNRIESLKTLNNQQVADALAEATAVRQLIATEHTSWKIAEAALRKKLKWALGCGICAFVLSLSTVVYVFRFLRG